MQRTNTETIASVLSQFLKENKLDKPLNEKRLIDSWAEVLGGHIKQYTTDVSVKNEVLYVSISSSVLRHELFLSRYQIRDKLNLHAGGKIIKAVIFR
jgi:predicted nucleic acid-binding Zn ribbon protein